MAERRHPRPSRGPARSPRDDRDSGFRRPGSGGGHERAATSGGRPAAGAVDDDLAFGIHAVDELVAGGADRVRQILLDAAAGPVPRKVADRARAAGIDVRVLPSPAFGELARGRPFQGIAARIRPFAYADLDPVLAVAAGRPGSLLIALDQVQDPQNLGSILRSAAFFGALGVILPQDRSAQVTPAVIRASAGGAARVPVVRVVNLARALRACADAGVVPVGAVARDGKRPADVPGDVPVVLVLGSEGEGLRRLVREACQVLVTIPSPGGFESLNVGVAAGVLMHALVGRSRSGGPGGA